LKGIVVYRRAGCHLCDILIEELLPLVRGRSEIEIRDIDTREEWRREYDARVPVVEHDGNVVCQYHLDRQALERILGPR